MKSLNHLAKTSSLLLLAAWACLSIQAAEAFPWWTGYSPLTGSTTRMWLSRTLYNPSNLFRSGYGGYSAPYYLANTLGWNAAYMVGQGINSAGRNNNLNYNNISQQQAMDQITPARWWTAKQNATGQTFQAPAMNSSAPAILAPDADPFFMPVPITNDPQAQPNPGPITESSTLPAPAPDFRPADEASKGKKHQKKHKTHAEKAQTNSQTSSAQAPATQSMQANPASKANPFVQAFVDHVNQNFGSDINQALTDKQTRGYAEAIGLVENGNRFTALPSDRVELIRHILQDQNEDSLTKVNTIRMLIKH